ncbi:hypothetical protein [Methylobacterium nodulans]|uniref:Uncharacterized protein n=1 Tax=Methylobacterium nodulans (strain LMG 21967 / CNCM I-2342 / ORS 2060) TaxID=460265 RepID=B8IAM7_METNO|nr:hypothetical protein [Methylobacterium nodulans]ACL61072.1 hypothetical protein Mnod_6267 [Methylobacterium nodulans ORS 2060]
MFDRLRGAWNVFRGWRQLGSGYRHSLKAAIGFYRAQRRRDRRLRRTVYGDRDPSPRDRRAPLYGGHALPDTTLAAAHGHGPDAGCDGGPGGN